MIISLINHSNGKVKDTEILTVIRAINRQIEEDFEPYWSLRALVRRRPLTSKTRKAKPRRHERRCCNLFVG